MIKVTDVGICVDGEGQGGSSPHGKGILIRFEKGGAIWLDRAFVEHAMTLFECFDRDDEQYRRRFSEE